MQLMDVIATVWMVTVGSTVPLHQLAAASSIAMGMPLWIKTVRMVACATVLTDGLARAARSLRLVMPNSIALVTEQQLILMQPTDASAAVWTVSAGLTVQFRQLAAARITAMGMPPWTKTAQMAVCATVPMDSLAKAARSLRPAMPRRIVLGMV